MAAGKYISLCLTRVIHQWRHFQGARLGHRSAKVSFDTNIHLCHGHFRGVNICCSEDKYTHPG